MRPGAARFALSSSAQQFLATSASIVRHTGSMALCIQSDEFLGVVPGPVGASGLERLLARDEYQHVDELTFGEAGVEESSAPFTQLVCVPQRPFGVGAVRFYVGLMVGFTDLVKETFELAGKIRLHHLNLPSTT
jgi:hypothetical protein